MDITPDLPFIMSIVSIYQLVSYYLPAVEFDWLMVSMTTWLSDCVHTGGETSLSMSEKQLTSQIIFLLLNFFYIMRQSI